MTIDDEEWNVYWASVSRVRKLFNFESGVRLRDDQIINHFPNHFELTRKDLMVKNIKRYRKNLEKNGNPIAARNSNGTYIHLDFVPSTYLLPNDYGLFEEEFKKILKGTKWILKPTCKAQGAGIFIIDKLIQLKKWSPSYGHNKEEPYVVSRYIEKPLLIGGKKFDLRLYVLVTSYRPLRVYFHKQGFGRFSNVKYTLKKEEMNNTEIHLTNVAIQKHGADYNPNHGNKWSFENFITYVEGIFGNEASVQLIKKIKVIIIHSLLAVQSVIINDKHCFECYGYDILVDEDLKPWLLEVNASPSLSATTKNDRDVKRKLLKDVFACVVPPDFPSTQISQGCASWNTSAQVGDFELIYDETNPFRVDTAHANDVVKTKKVLTVNRSKTTKTSWK
ncbi:tubulin tyrosine ligase-like protein [Reticulomyxa filosa]|uniref:Tubulin tyrosine ligase-like protein n=1 Tax=Reticulomyxa filosa TaxID=46433 RepID=X6P256_RETFI|nr:tubulin tyrosine ligase-like protein [Reticulomyxa filosa]|eukprot:ETO32154.1 tubulin tyrosine ligase-like protein [Reticulomyxa filosa]